MQIRIMLDGTQVEESLREVIADRLRVAARRFDGRIQALQVVLGDEHGRHGAPRYRCRLSADLVDGTVVTSAAHAHPQGALTGAVQALRRRLADAASGLPKRERRSASRSRGKIRNVA